MKKVLCLLLVLVLTLGIEGCGAMSSGEFGKSDEQKGADSDVRKGEIDINNITISIKNDLYRNEKVVAFDYLNNTDYTISNVDILYKLKDGVEIEAVRNLGEPFTEASADGFIVLGSGPSVTKPGETSSVSRFTTEDRSYFESEKIFDYLEPDYMQIQYLKNGCIYETRYEYATSEYIDSSDTKIAHQWGDGSLAKMIPEPKSEIVQVDGEFDDLFNASFKADSLETYDSYLEACKNAGFIVDPLNSSVGYEAKNENGYEIDLQIFKTKNQISIMVIAP